MNGDFPITYSDEPEGTANPHGNIDGLIMMSELGLLMQEGSEQEPIRFPAVTAYGEQSERSLLQQIVAQFIQRANEPQDPFATIPYKIFGQDEGSLLQALVMSVKGLGEVKRRMGKSAFHLPHGEQVVQQKQREAENVANWMKTWFRSPITRERLAEGGRSPQDVEALASKAENLQFEVGMPSARPFDRTLLGMYDVEEDKSYMKPYTAMGDFGSAGIPYFRSKPFFEDTAAHELMHQMTVGKMTEKEAKLIGEGVYDYKKVYDMASKQKGAWGAFMYKHEPYMKGGGGGDPADPESYFYHAKPEEIYARIMSVRRSLGLFPGQQVLEKMLETIKNSPAMNDLLRYMPMKHVKKLMNTLAVKEEDTIESFA